MPITWNTVGLRRTKTPALSLSIALTIAFLIVLPINILSPLSPWANSVGEAEARSDNIEKPVPIDLQINGTKMAGRLQLIAHQGMQITLPIQGAYPASAFEAAGVNSIPISFSAKPLPPDVTIAPWINIKTSPMKIVKGENAHTSLTITAGNITEDWQYTEFLLQANYVDPISAEDMTNSIIIAITTHIEEADHHIIPNLKKANTNNNNSASTTAATTTTTTLVADQETTGKVTTEKSYINRGLNFIAVTTAAIGGIILLLLIVLRRRGQF